MKRRVVITGNGVTSSLGFCASSLFDALQRGESGIRLCPEWADKMLTPKPVVAAPVELSTAVAKSIGRHYRRSMGRAALFAALAARDAQAQSGLTSEELASGRVGCIVSSTLGSASETYDSALAIVKKELFDMSSCQFFKIVSHSSAFNVANFLGINGVQLSPCSACASALQSIGLAYEQIILGRQDAVFAGGSDEVTPIVLESFRLLHALAELEDGGDYSPRALSRPFDAHRTGLVCGEGAGIFVLEEREHALARGATIHAEILGYATNCTGAQISQSDSKSIIQCMKLAMDDAGVSPEDIDYVSAHATSTPAGDREEAAAIRTFFGDRVPVSSLKGQLGHTLGASGAIELNAVLEMIRHGVVLPTANLDDIGDDCAGLHHVRAAENRPVHTVLKNCIAFGGVNTTLILRG